MKKIIQLVLIFIFVISCTKTNDKKVTTSTNKKASEKVEKNAAQSFIDLQKKHMDKAKASMEKNQKAQEDQKKEIDNLLGN